MNKRYLKRNKELYKKKMLPFRKMPAAMPLRHYSTELGSIKTFKFSLCKMDSWHILNMIK